MSETVHSVQQVVTHKNIMSHIEMMDRMKTPGSDSSRLLWMRGFDACRQ